MNFTSSNALTLIEKYDLGPAVRYILEHNTSQALPYHSFTHCLQVMCNAYTLYLESDRSFVKPPKQLMMAALFHDFAHSGGFYVADKFNIERAVKGASDYLRTEREGMTGRDEHIMELFEYGVTDLIRETEYAVPQKPIDEKRSRINGIGNYVFCAECLRDADMLVNTEEMLLTNLVGIKEELFRGVDWRDYLVDTVKFLKGIKYYTHAGRYYGSKLVKRAVEDVERLYSQMFGGDMSQPQLPFQI